MSLIISLIKQYFSYIMIAIIVAFAGMAYFFVVYYAKKYIKQLKPLRFLHASFPLILINILFLIIAMQRLNQDMMLFAKGFAYFLLSLSATIVYTVLAIAYTSNRNKWSQIKKTKTKRKKIKTIESPE